jgi:hypothetical protein
MEEKKEIQFKALTDGLGFHPFANGLPYAPNPTKNYSQGSGAYSAGQPSFVTPKTPAPRPATPSYTQPLRQLARAQTSVAPQAPQNLLQNTAHFGFEYVMKRFLAYFVDSFLNTFMGGTVLGLCLWKQTNSFDFMMNPGILAISALFLLFFNWAIITAQEVALHTSLGKKFFGLKLEGSLGAILARALLFIPSIAILGLGSLWCLLDKNRRSWYDLATGVQPKEIAEL